MFGILKAQYQKIKSAFQKAGASLGSKIRYLFNRQLDDNILEELEELLYQSDLGVSTVQDLTTKIQKFYRQNPYANVEELIQYIKNEVLGYFPPLSQELPLKTDLPHVILVVGSNGYGKTTTIAKLARRYKSQGLQVLLVAADTFRAAATEQLTLWAEQIGVDIVKGQLNSDPSAVVFDGLQAAKARHADIVIIDTAGRLHTKAHLMQELEKLRRVAQKNIVGAPHETLLVLDATTGQIAVDQAKQFNQYTPIDGIVLTKLDGSAKGGIVIAIQQEAKLPVKWIGVGEGVEDLETFDREQFIEALFQ
ncbi:MAG: ftsY [Chlamydiales bacterium]|jgi:fused signal recognition particle receptor|nr:ftsY [Chlamydiales bacterium]